jgi:myosin-5
MGGLEMLRQVEAKYPALLFKQQLTAYVEKIYGMIRDNLKKEISPLLGLCIQAPRTSRASLGKASVRAPNLSAQQTLSSHWHSIISSLSTLLTTMRANHVCVSLALILFCTPFRIIPLRNCTKKIMIWWISMSEHEHHVIVGHLPYCLITAMDK